MKLNVIQLKKFFSFSSYYPSFTIFSTSSLWRNDVSYTYLHVLVDSGAINVRLPANALPLASAMACCLRCPRLCTCSLAYTLCLGLCFVALGTSRILLLKYSANAGAVHDWMTVHDSFCLPKSGAQCGQVCTLIVFRYEIHIMKPKSYWPIVF